MQRELGQQTFGLVFAAHQLGRRIEPERRLQQPLGDQLGQHVRDPHRQTLGPTARAPLQGVGELSPQTEDLVGVTKDQGPRFGQRQPPTGAFEELFAEGPLQGPDLTAQGRLGEFELLAGPCYRTVLRDGPKIE
jgi:hypothetical protein